MKNEFGLYADLMSNKLYILLGEETICISSSVLDTGEIGVDYIYEWDEDFDTVNYDRPYVWFKQYYCADNLQKLFNNLVSFFENSGYESEINTDEKTIEAQKDDRERYTVEIKNGTLKIYF